jgi:hypothetical protein
MGSGGMNRLSPPKACMAVKKVEETAGYWRTLWLMPCVDCGKGHWVRACSKPEGYKGKRARCKSCGNIGCNTLEPPEGVRTRRKAGRIQWHMPCSECEKKYWVNSGGNNGRYTAERPYLCTDCAHVQGGFKNRIVPPEGVRTRISTTRGIGYQWCLPCPHCGKMHWVAAGHASRGRFLNCMSCRSFLITTKRLYPDLTDEQCSEILKRTLAGRAAVGRMKWQSIRARNSRKRKRLTLTTDSNERF